MSIPVQIKQIGADQYREMGCGECLHGAGLDFAFSMAFQPIVDIRTNDIYAYEALARGVNNEPAGHVFQHVNDENCYRFDQACRVQAIRLASTLGMDCLLNINFMPNAVYRPELCIRTTLEAAREFSFPVERIVFEFTEGERIHDHDHVRGIVKHYQQRGFLTAIDDFGAGYSGLNLLADIQTDLLKLDMLLLRDIDTDPVRQAIVRATIQMCLDLKIRIIAEGIETRAEFHTLRDMGIKLFQGYYFAKPAFETLVTVPVEQFA